MFGQRPRLPVNFYFPTFRSAEAPTREASAKHVDEYMAAVWDQLRTALQEAQAQSTAEAHWQKWYYDQKIGTVNLKSGNLVLVKADAFKGKREIREWWEEETSKVVHQIMTNVPSYEVMDQHGWSCILNWNYLLLIMSEVGIPGVHVSITHGTDVPVPLHASPLLREVRVWRCHKRTVGGWSPNIQPARLLWGGLMESYDSYPWHPLEHPQMMGEDPR